MQDERKKVCPQCSRLFGCGVGTDSSLHCWCDRLPAIMPLKEEEGCYCPVCLKQALLDNIDHYLATRGLDKMLLKKVRKVPQQEDLQEGLDYYINEQGYWVFTAWYHLKRGSCCKNGCRHCPYGFKKKKQ